MTVADLRSEFGRQALARGFKKSGSRWVVEIGESFVLLELQRSSYSARYFVNLHVFVQGMFGFRYDSATNLQTKNSTCFRREPPEFSAVLDLSNDLTESDRRRRIKELFDAFILPFSRGMHSRDSILRLRDEHPDMLFLSPAVVSELQSKT